MAAKQEGSAELVAKFNQVLKSNHEEEVQSFLKSHPQILLNTFGDRWVVNDCLPKFKFGNEYVSDFVLVTGQSGRYEVTLIELEPPTERPFTQTGSYGRRLNGAINQITDWLGWIHSNEHFFRTSLSNKMIDRYGRDQVAQTGRLFIKSRVVIGRRSMMSDSDNRRRATLFDHHKGMLEVVPYDRLLERIGKPIVRD